MFCFNLIIQTSLKKQRLHQRGRREIVRMALITNHTHPSKEMLNKKTYFLNSTALDNVVEFNRLAIRFQALFSRNLLLFRQMHTGVFIAHLICASWTPAIVSNLITSVLLTHFLSFLKSTSVSSEREPTKRFDEWREGCLAFSLTRSS